MSFPPRSSVPAAPHLAAARRLVDAPRVSAARSRFAWRLAATRVAVLVLAAMLAGCSDKSSTTTASPASAPKHNVLMVSFDTLRADRLGAYGGNDWGSSISPHVDELASHGVTFDHVIATRGQTHPSLGALLSGKYPITTGLRENGYMLLPQHETIIQRLKQAGFQTGVFIANFNKSDAMDKWVFRGAEVSGDGEPQPLDRAAMAQLTPQERSDRNLKNESHNQELWDDHVERSALAFFDGLAPDKPFAAWVHFYNVHKPYNPPAKYLTRYGDSPDEPAVLRAPGPDSGPDLEKYLREITLGDREVSAAELHRVLGLYDGAVSATDERLGHLLDKLKEKGLYDSTFFVFTADHGEELFDHNRYFFHGNSVYESVLRLPLIIAGPGLPAGTRVAAANVQNIDIAPTILELLGLPATPDDMEGRPLGKLLRGESSEPPRPFAFSEWQDVVYVVTDGNYSYIHNPHHAHLLKEPYQSFADEKVTRGYALRCFEAYDLRSDPHEQHDLLADKDPSTLGTSAGLPPEIAPLRKALDRWLAEAGHEREMSWPGVPDAMAEKLRNETMSALGYVEGGKGSRGFLVKEPCAPKH